MYRSSSEKTRKPVLIRKLNEETEWAYYSCAEDAAKIVGCTGGYIQQCATGKHKQVKGYEVKYCQSDDYIQEGENWVPVKVGDGSILGEVTRLPTTGSHQVMVSDYGRFQDSTGRRGYGSTGIKGYCAVNIGGNNYQIHAVIWHAFLPEGVDASLYTSVDHINHDKSDNRLVNLRGANATIQNNNQADPAAAAEKRSETSGSAVECKNQLHGMYQWQHFASDTKAAAKTRVRHNVISKNLSAIPHGEIYTHKKTQWQFRRPAKDPEQEAAQSKLECRLAVYE